MANVTREARAARLADTALLWARGYGIGRIARGLGIDWQTAKRYVAQVEREAAGGLDVAAERRRLLAAARELETTAWQEFAQASNPNVRLGALARVQAAQAQALAVVRDLAGAELEARLAAVEEQLEAQGATRLADGTLRPREAKWWEAGAAN